MSKIKPRKNWNIHSKPYPPAPPTPPQKVLIRESGTSLRRERLHDGEGWKLSDLIPVGMNPEDVWVGFYEDYDGDFTGYTMELSTSVQLEGENPHYDEEMKRYEENLTKWKEKDSLHRAELKEWKAWVKQEKEEKLQEELRRAEELLKKHGRVK